MHRAAILSLAIIVASFCMAGGLANAQARTQGTAIGAQQAVEFSAQARRDRRRPRVYIERQPAAWDYPRPGDVSWPGPGAVRQCVDWYQVEHRLSGSVVTPQMRCRWVRG